MGRVQTPVLAGIVAMHGYQGLMVATLMAGVLLVTMGLFRFGALLRYVPYPVIAGFTTGIAVIIFVGQWQYFFGLPAPAHPPATPSPAIGPISGHVTSDFGWRRDPFTGRSLGGAYVLRAWVDDTGVPYEIDLPNPTLGRDVAELLRTVCCPGGFGHMARHPGLGQLLVR